MRLIMLAIKKCGLYILSHHLVMMVLASLACLTFVSDGAAFNPDINGSYIESMALQKDGKVLISGNFTTISGVSRNQIARLNSDGSLDTTFDTGSGPNGRVYAIAIQDDGKVLIGGDFTTIDGVNRNRIARLNSNGSLDTTFNTGTGVDGSVYAVAIQDDGKVLIGGLFNSVRGNTRNYIARLNADSSVDQTFSTGTGTNSSVLAIAIQDDGKVLIGGAFTSVRGNTRNYIARLNADSSVDQTFATGSGANFYVLAIAMQDDGKVLIGGHFTSVDGSMRNYIARLNADSSVDQTFATGSGANNSVRAIAIQDDGKIVIGGEFTSVRKNLRNYIARLNADSSVDQNFATGSGVNDPVFNIAIQDDGKVLISGAFTNVDGVKRNKIARLKSNGSLDNILCFPVKATNGNVTMICF